MSVVCFNDDLTSICCNFTKYICPSAVLLLHTLKADKIEMENNAST